MANTVAGTHLTGNHAARPAGNAVPDGTLYSCSTHSLVYLSNYAGNSWSTWANLSGTGFADPMTTRGDMIYRNAANSTDRLGIPAAGQVIGRSGSDLAAVYPPGYQLDRVEFTGSTNVTVTTEATAVTLVTSNSVTFDGTECCFEFYVPNARPQATATAFLLILLFDDTASTSASIGRLANLTTPAASNSITSVFARRFLTPAAGARVFSVRAIVSAATGVVAGGAGGTGAYMPGYLRITKA